APLGSAAWRARNRVLCTNALTLWSDLDAAQLRGAVIYADPPYSKDHYSRYYHVLETLVRYDYPSAAGAGRYRPDRYSTPFSLRRQAPAAFNALFQAI